MALILCPECEKEVSDTTKTCVHCGYVFKTSSKSGLIDQLEFEGYTTEEAEYGVAAVGY